MGALLTIVTGPSAAGKTGLAERLADDLAIPLIAKDAIKEQLFNSLGWNDRGWSRKIGGASYDLIWLTTERILAADVPAIIEGNFRGTVAETRLRTIAATTGCRFFQINCWADADILIERYRERAKIGDRHPGHLDDPEDPSLRAQLAEGGYDPLDIGGDVHELNMNDKDTIDYDRVLRRVRARLKG